MRAVIRLVLLSLAVALAGPSVMAGAADPPVAAPSSSSRPTDADLIGTWAGTVMLDGTSEPMDGGLITIRRTGDERLAVTVGPDARVRYSCVRLARTDEGLRFEVSLPGEETRLLAYDVAIDRGTMTGTVTFVRHGLTQPARLAFLRQ